MTTTNDVMSQMEQLQATLSETKEEIRLHHLPTLVTDRAVETIKHCFVDDEDDDAAVNKWFSHRKNNQSRDSTVEVQGYENSQGQLEYVLVRSEMYSHRKATQTDSDGHYHAVWVVGRDDSSSQEFFIHRFEWANRFETPLDEAGWDLSDIRSRLGFDAPLPDADEQLEAGEWYPFQGDIKIRRDGVDVDSLIEERARSIASEKRTSIKRERKRDAYESWLESTDLTDTEGVTIRCHSSIHTPSEIHTSLAESDTDGLKRIQQDIGIPEEEIRGMMDSSWQRLTAERRQRLLKRWIKQTARRETKYDAPDTDDLLPEFKQELQEQIDDNRGRQNILIGNHLISIGDAVEFTDDLAPAVGDDHSLPPSEVSVLITDETTIKSIHDEHPTVSRTVQPGILSLDVLPRHEQA